MPVSLYSQALASSSKATTTTSRTDPCADPAPACPACGGLKCLCRPRFFPGQLLSDEDLNRLQQYVIDKNRLHNRYLVGWGVACGMEVVCSPCETGQVTVTAGYALSPCGDDIVVCGDQAVDICALIGGCRPVTTTVCTPAFGQAPTACRDDVERWVLAVCYDEQASRPINALTGAGDSASASGCRCGGSAGCGCGAATAKSSGCSCGSAASGSKSGGCGCGAAGSAYQPAATRRKLLPSCEPTQVCEGFRFTAWKAPKTATGLTGLRGLGQDQLQTQAQGGDLMIALLYANRARFGPLLERVLCCVLKAMDLRASLIDDGEASMIKGGAAVTTYREYAQALQEFASDFSLHHCNFTTTVRGQYDSAMAWASSRDDANLSAADRAELVTRYRTLDNVWMQVASKCLCSALLPACPPPAASNCVPLAVVTVRNGSTCQVLDICNWQERKLLVTWPTVQYWLSWLPWAKLREWIARICCSADGNDTAYRLMTVMLGIAVQGAKRTSTSMDIAVSKQANAIDRAAVPRGALERQVASTGSGDPTSQAVPGSFDAAMDSSNLLLHMLADYQSAREGGEQQPLWAALAARLVDGSAFAPLAGNAALREVDVADVEKRLGVDALREQVASLQQTVERQDAVLQALQIVNGQRAKG